MTSTRYEAENAKRLIGGTITGVAVSNEETSWGLKIRVDVNNHFIAWIDQDPEGNGPGHLEIERMIPLREDI